MSGGAFGYQEYRLLEIIKDLEHIIEPRKTDSDDDYRHDFSESTFAEFRTTVALLKQAYVRILCIDRLVSADTGEESFSKDLADDLQNLDSFFA
jgi:hypothetical protein